LFFPPDGLFQLDGNFEETVGGKEGGVGEVGGTRPALRIERRLAAENGVSSDDVTARLIECGGTDFLMAGAESTGRSRLARRGAVDAAVRALMFHIDPDHATLFWKPGDF